MSSYVFKDVERKNRIEAKDAPLDRTLRYYCPGCDKAHMHIRSYDGLRRKYFAPYFGHGHELGCPFSTTKNYDCAKFVVSRANFEKWLRALTKPIKETATNETVLTFKKNNGVSKSSGTLRAMYFELKYLNPEEYYGSLKVKEIFVSKKHLSKNKKDIEGWKILEGQRVTQVYWFNNIPKEIVLTTSPNDQASIFVLKFAKDKLYYEIKKELFLLQMSTIIVVAGYWTLSEENGHFYCVISSKRQISIL